MAMAMATDTDMLRTSANGQASLERSVGYWRIAASGIALVALLPWLVEISGLTGWLLAVCALVSTDGAVAGMLPRLRPIQTVVFVFMFSWLCVGPVYQLSHHQAIWGDSWQAFSPGVIERAAIGQTAFFVGLRLGFSYRRGVKSGASQTARLTLNSLFPWAYLAMAVAITPHAITVRGGLRAMFTDRAEAVAAISAAGLGVDQAGGAAYALVRIAPGALALASAYLFATQIKKRRCFTDRPVPLSLYLAFGCAVALLVVHSNPIANSRFTAAVAFVPIALVFLSPRSARAGVLFGAAVLMASLIVYPLLNVFRYHDSKTQSATSASFASPDFDGFQQAVNESAYVHENGHSSGEYLISGLLFVVPRSVWDAKARPASVDIAEWRNYRYTNLSLPIDAEIDLEFGLAGVAAVSLIGGVVLSRLDQAWTSSPHSVSACLTPFVAIMMLSVIRGPFGANGPSYLMALGLLIVGTASGRRATERSGPLVAVVGRPEPGTTLREV